MRSGMHDQLGPLALQGLTPGLMVSRSWLVSILRMPAGGSDLQRRVILASARNAQLLSPQLA